jgi:hypothetical protein
MISIFIQRQGQSPIINISCWPEPVPKAEGHNPESLTFHKSFFLQNSGVDLPTNCPGIGIMEERHDLASLSAACHVPGKALQTLRQVFASNLASA